MKPAVCAFFVVVALGAGCGGASDGPAGADASGVDEVPADARSADGSAVDGGGPCLPGDVLALTDWKLTLPIDLDSDGKADEVAQPALAGFEHDEHFAATAACDGVRFRAHAGGATTSGSGYPRSELREMMNGGGDKASWSSSSGTHTMEITQAVIHLPEVKPHVVVGQIHDDSDDVIVFRLEDEQLFVDINGSDGPTLDPSYTLGEVFTVKFVVEGDQTRCYYNGNLAYTLEQSYSGAYFKAGVYTQSNESQGDAPDAYGEAILFDLTVDHS